MREIWDDISSPRGVRWWYRCSVPSVCLSSCVPVGAEWLFGAVSEVESPCSVSSGTDSDGVGGWKKRMMRHVVSVASVTAKPPMNRSNLTIPPRFAYNTSILCGDIRFD